MFVIPAPCHLSFPRKRESIARGKLQRGPELWILDTFGDERQAHPDPPKDGFVLLAKKCSRIGASVKTFGNDRRNCFMTFIFRFFIRFYQIMISPLFGMACRFHPSCSNYALQSLEHHGFVKGTLYSVRRLVRCHPFSKGGYDPVHKI